MATTIKPEVTRQKGQPIRLGKTLRFMQLLWELQHSLDSLSKRMEGSFGVTGPQRVVLRILGRAPGLSAGELSEVLRLHPSTLTGILRRLEAQRLVERADDPGDGRRAVLSLSPEGEAVNQLRVGTVEAAVQRALNRVTAEDQEATTRLLRVLVEELEP